MNSENPKGKEPKDNDSEDDEMSRWESKESPVSKEILALLK